MKNICDKKKRICIYISLVVLTLLIINKGFKILLPRIMLVMIYLLGEEATEIYGNFPNFIRINLVESYPKYLNNDILIKLILLKYPKNYPIKEDLILYCLKSDDESMRLKALNCISENNLFISEKIHQTLWENYAKVDEIEKTLILSLFVAIYYKDSEKIQKVIDESNKLIYSVKPHFEYTNEENPSKSHLKIDGIIYEP